MSLNRLRWFALLLAALHGLASFAVAAGESVAQTRLPRTNLLVFRSASGAVAPVKTIADWQRRRAEILGGIQQVMGPLPGREKRCALEPVVIEEVDCGDYIRRRVTYTAEPGARVPAYLLVPKKALANGVRCPAGCV